MWGDLTCARWLALERDGTSVGFPQRSISHHCPRERVVRKVLVCLALSLFARSASAQIVASVNAAGPPGLGSSYQFVGPDVGWFYTPTSSFSLTGVNFHFGTTDGRTVTEKVFTNTPAAGGTLLGMATFAPGSAGFYGGTFAPISFLSGTTYFIGVLNVQGFDGMVSTSPTATNLLEAIDSGSGTFSTQFQGPSSGNVMMQLVGTSVVAPEPSTYALVGAGLLGICMVARRRRQA